MRYLPLMLVLLVAAAFGQGATITSPSVPPTRVPSPLLMQSMVDTGAGGATKTAVDSMHAIGAGRSDSTLSPQGPVNPKDSGKSLAKQPADQKNQQTMKLAKRRFNGRHQVLLAVFMMIFVIGIVTMAQQWNPR